MASKKVIPAKKPKKVMGHAKNPEVTEWRKGYFLRLLEKGFSLKLCLLYVDTAESTFYLWKKRDVVFKKKAEAYLAMNDKKITTERIHNIFSMVDKMKPYLQRHLTETEACAESGVNINTWKQMKKDLRKANDDVARWFLQDIENAKMKIFALAKNTLTTGVKLNPKLAFDFLKSTQPGIYTDGRKEITGANGEQLTHAYPMSPGDYQKFLEEIAGKKEKQDEES